MMDWHTLLSLYPFTPSETMHILGELAIALYALFALKDWNKLKTLAEVEALKLINETLSKEEKRNKVISYMAGLIPLKLKPFVNKNTLGYLVDLVYQNRVRPHVKRQQDVVVKKELNNKKTLDELNNEVKNIE